MRPELHEKIKIRKDFYCPAPFMHVYANAGKDTLKWCCEARYSSTKLSDDKSLKNFFYNDEQLQNVRRSVLKGIEPIECHICGDRERKGWSSDRLEYIARDSEDLTPDIQYGNSHKQPLALDIRPGNICNLKCRMCDAGNSSEIAKELNKHSELKQWYATGEDIKEKVTFDLVSFYNEIDFSLVKRINVLGGEPTIDPDTLNFLQKIIDSGHSDIKLNITSNCTNWDKPKVRSLFEQFKWLNVCMSIDGTESTYEYIRTGTSWSTVLKNIEELKTYKNLIGLSHNMVVQMYNIFDIRQWLTFFYRLRQNINKTCKFELQYPYIQVCEEPPHFHPSILNNDDKNFVMSEINKFVKDVNGVPDKFTNQVLIPIQTSLDDPIHTSFSKVDYPTIKPDSIKELRDHFKRHTNIQNKIRGTKAEDYLHKRILKYL